MYIYDRGVLEALAICAAVCLVIMNNLNSYCDVYICMVQNVVKVACLSCMTNVLI